MAGVTRTGTEKWCIGKGHFGAVRATVAVVVEGETGKWTARYCDDCLERLEGRLTGSRQTITSTVRLR